MRRRCIGHGRVDCPRCRPKAWGRKPPARQAQYNDPGYQRDRKLAIAREPACHWRFPGCTLKSTTADHLLSLAKGGTNALENLVGSCARCNERRGAAEGRATMKRRRRGR
jgi:5-methylcytosine-specific restriction endonuclease McrA